MKNSKIFLIIIIFSTSLMVGFGSIAHALWIKVHYARTTGPEFVVDDSPSKLRKKFGVKSNVDYSMIMTDIETDMEYGYLDSKSYFLFGTFAGFKCDSQPCRTKFIKLEKSFLVPVWLINSVIIVFGILCLVSLLILIIKVWVSNEK